MQFSQRIQAAPRHSFSPSTKKDEKVLVMIASDFQLTQNVQANLEVRTRETIVNQLPTFSADSFLNTQRKKRSYN